MTNMSDFIYVPTEPAIIEIDPRGKYIFYTGSILTQEEFAMVRQKVSDWLNGNDTFIFINGSEKDIKIVKVE